MTKKFNFLIFSALLIFLCISSVSAMDNMTDDTIGSCDLEDSLITLENDKSDEIDIRANPATYKYSASKVEYSFKIYNATSNTPINSARYSFDYDIDDYAIEGVSDSNGLCVVKLKPSKIDGEAIINVHYNGLWNYKVITLDVLKVSVSAPSKTVNYNSNKYFKATVKDWYDNPVKNLKVNLKIYTGKTSKTYKLCTDKNGVILFNTKSLKIGSHKVVISSSKEGYQFSKVRKIVVKKKPYTVTFNLKPYSNYYSEVRLKTGDLLLAATSNRNGQHGKGVTIGTLIDAGLEGQHSTKMIKGVVYYKNKNTGKIITRTQTKTLMDGLNLKKLPWISGYVPYKAKVWYQKR